jgi:hypothetical protein
VGRVNVASKKRQVKSWIVNTAGMVERLVSISSLIYDLEDVIIEKGYDLWPPANIYNNIYKIIDDILYQKSKRQIVHYILQRNTDPR